MALNWTTDKETGVGAAGTRHGRYIRYYGETGDEAHQWILRYRPVCGQWSTIGKYRFALDLLEQADKHAQTT